MMLAQAVGLMAQQVGNIRGIVTDRASGQALAYVSVTILNSNPAVGAVTDSAGYFRINDLPVGRYDIRSSYLGYEPVVFREMMVTSGKEAFLEVSMQENVRQLGEVTILPRTNKEVPLNQMAMAGARMLSVEEASRYAGGFDDPARLVTAFAGVLGSMNSNGIAIRGNSPQFLQWRIEGAEVPNPTHFSDITGVGGGILTALSSQVLGNSDFFTGAFPAEYGNALSGVFDMQLRSGNNQQYEHTAQIGTLGVEFASEGPFQKGKQASYLFNYRYSSMALAGSLLPDLTGDAAGMRYQDLSFKVNLPTKRAGTFSLWGIGIIDHYLQSVPKDTLEWLNSFEGYGDFKQTKATGGIGHKISLNNSYFKSALVASFTQNRLLMDQTYSDWTSLRVTDMRSTNWNISFDSYFNKKFSAAHTNRTGINATGLFYNIDYNMSPDVNIYPPGSMNNYAKGSGRSLLLSAFSQSSIRLNNRLSGNIGLHGMYFFLNKKWVVEPRVGIKWQASQEHSFGLAYGEHSRRENLDYYFVEAPQPGGGLVNKNLDFAKAHHFVFAYDWSISEYIHLKVEPYYQYLYHIPVAKDSLLSLINYRDFYMMLPLVNSGKGENYGIDFTLERYLHRGYYYLFTASLFKSRYMGGDGVWRNTRLDRTYLLNALAGKEWKIGKQKQNMLSLSLRFSFQGGERYIPLDEEASKASQSLVYDTSQAYAARFSPDFISHFTAAYKINKKSISHEFSLKVINVTGNEEFDSYYYDYRADKPVKYMSAIVLPNISYKIEF